MCRQFGTQNVSEECPRCDYMLIRGVSSGLKYDHHLRSSYVLTSAIHDAYVKLIAMSVITLDQEVSSSPAFFPRLRSSSELRTIDRAHLGKKAFGAMQYVRLNDNLTEDRLVVRKVPLPHGMCYATCNWVYDANLFVRTDIMRLALRCRYYLCLHRIPQTHQDLGSTTMVCE